MDFHVIELCAFVQENDFQYEVPIVRWQFHCWLLAHLWRTLERWAMLKVAFGYLFWLPKVLISLKVGSLFLSSQVPNSFRLRASFITNSMSGCNILNIAFYLIDWYGFVQDLLLRRSIVRWWPWPYWPHLWENWRGEHKVAFNACRWNENFCRTGILAGEILGAGFCDNESMRGRRGGSAVSLQLACSMYCEDAEFRRLLPHFKIMILSIKHETLGSTLWLLFGKWLSFGY